MQRTVNYNVKEDDDSEEQCQQVHLENDEFSGLIGNLASGFMKEGGLDIGRLMGGGGKAASGNGSGDISGISGCLAGNLLSGGGEGTQGMHYTIFIHICSMLNYHMYRVCREGIFLFT